MSYLRFLSVKLEGNKDYYLNYIPRSVFKIVMNKVQIAVYRQTDCKTCRLFLCDLGPVEYRCWRNYSNINFIPDGMIINCKKERSDLIAKS